MKTEVTFENAAADILDFAAAEYRSKTAEDVTKAMRSRVDCLLYEVKGYGSKASERAEFGAMLSLLVIAARKRGITPEGLVGALYEVPVNEEV